MLPILDQVLQPGVYEAYGARWNGTNSKLATGADLTGSADSKLFTFSVWISPLEDTAARQQRLLCASSTAGGSGQRFRITKLATSNLFNIVAVNAANTTILDVSASTGQITAGVGYKHIACSFDMSDTAKRHIYIDDVSDLATVTTYTDDTIDFTQGDWCVGAKASNSEWFNGDIAEMWFMQGVYMDLSAEPNRRRFITADRKPVDLGLLGEKPTGARPILYLRKPFGSFHQNLGSGGDFTVAGTIAEGVPPHIRA